MSNCIVCDSKVKKRYDNPPRPPSKYCSLKCSKIDCSIVVDCGCCGKSYSIPRSRKLTAKYCSKECFDKTQTIYKKEIKSCAQCGSDVETHKGNRRSKKVYCDKECLTASQHPKKIAKCKCCNNDFESRFKRGKYIDTCSQACYSELKRETVSCVNCHTEYSRPARITKLGRAYNVCSRDCMTEYARGKKAHSYNHDDKYISNNTVWVRSGDGIAGSNYGWIQEHRKAVSDYIGRPLTKGSEQILHINGDNLDNRLENIYVCLNNSEMAYILQNFNVPYPQKSNVDTLKRECLINKHNKEVINESN